MSRGGAGGEGRLPKKTPPKSVSAPTSRNGKGDAPRNVSSKFKENYDKIKWDSQKEKNSENS